MYGTYIVVVVNVVSVVVYESDVVVIVVAALLFASSLGFWNARMFANIKSRDLIKSRFIVTVTVTPKTTNRLPT